MTVAPFLFFFIGGNVSCHGITFWAILLYCSPIVLLIAAVSVILGAPVKRQLIRRQLSATEVIQLKDLIPSLMFEVASITGALIFTVYVLEEWLDVGSTYHGDGWIFVFLFGSTLLSSLLMFIPHMRLLSRKLGERWPGISFMERFGLALQLGLVSPGAFAVVVIGLLEVLSK